MYELKKGLYHPTKDNLLWLNEQCAELKCTDTAGETHYPCSRCKLSNRFEKFTGIRLEKLEQVE